MFKIYVELLLAKRREWVSIPAQVKDSVKVLLRQYVSENQIDVVTYEEIVGEVYVD